MQQPTLALCGLAVWTAAAWSQNLLENAGFEDAPGGAPKLWTVSGRAELIDDAGIARSGRRCAKTRFDDAVAQPVKIEGGAAYRISGWIRRVEPGGTEVPKIKVYFLDAGGNRADVQAAEFKDVAADRWRQWETVVQAPVGAKTLNLTLRGLYGGGEWFYYDDLGIERIEALSWPSAETTPNLHGLIVTVPDVADVWTDALLRIPPGSLTPVDGQLDTSALIRGEEIRVALKRPERISWALVHSMRPGMNLGAAMLLSAGEQSGEKGGRRLLTESEPKQELVTSLVFEPTTVGEFVLQTPGDPVLVNEIQFFGLSETPVSRGECVEMRLTRAGPSETVAADLAKAYAAEEQRASVMALPAAKAESDAAGDLPLPAEHYLNAFATPRAEPFGLAAVGVDLVLPEAEEGTLIEITLRRPEELDVNIRWTTYTDRGLQLNSSRRDYATVFRAVSRIVEKRLSIVFDVPDLVYAAGEPVWLTLRTSSDVTLDRDRSRVAINLLSPGDAAAEYVPQLERLMRRMYSDASEAHAYDGRDWSQMVLGRYVRRVLELDPANKPANDVYRRIARVREEVVLERPGPAGAPDWAVWAREALVNRHEIITWWLDNRRQSNGELAGHINDDGEFSCNWPSHYLITGDERIAEALGNLADVAWEMSAGTGYTVGSRDVEHAAEDQSCTQPQVLLVDYGNPQAVERFMVMSRYLDFWTAVNEAGRRQFKSYMFTTKQIWDDPPFDVDHPYCPLAMVGTGHLLWYAHSPEVAKIFREEAESWALSCLSTDGGKPRGEIPKEIRFRDSKVDPYAPYPDNPVLQKRNSLYRGGAGAYIVRYFVQGAHTLTGDEVFDRVLKLWTPPDERKASEAEAALRRCNDPDASREGAWSPSQDETTLYEAWRATGDAKWLVEELKEVVRQQVRSRWLLTEAEPYTDRIPLPGRNLLARMFLGGWTSGKSHVPGHWVSWEGGGLDYAALVLDAQPGHLKARVYSFHAEPRPMTMRVWRLAHGRYDVSVGIDRDGDDRSDRQLLRQERELWRYDGAVEFTALPARTVLIELSLLEELDDVRRRPDLAIGRSDVTVDGSTVVVTVHNIGGSGSPPHRVEVRAEDGEVLGAGEAPALDAPHDLNPRSAQVRVELKEGAGPACIVVDPADEIAEITEANNRLPVQMFSSP